MTEILSFLFFPVFLVLYIVYNKKCVSACCIEYVAMFSFCDKNHMLIQIGFCFSNHRIRMRVTHGVCVQRATSFRYHTGKEVIKYSVAVMFSHLN